MTTGIEEIGAGQHPNHDPSQGTINCLPIFCLSILLLSVRYRFIYYCTQELIGLVCLGVLTPKQIAPIKAVASPIFFMSSPVLMPSAILGSTANPSSTPFVETGFASTAFIVLSSALVFLMTPAVGLLYSGLSNSKNALTMIMLSMLAYAIVAIQWVVFGFSLTFSETGSFFMGDFSWAGMTQIGSQSLPLTAPQMPSIAFALYQLQFAAVTVAIIFGAVSERVRIVPACVFMFIWTTVIYDPTAYWTWGARGWLKSLTCLNSLQDAVPCGLGAIDFAGGGPVHMASGFSALAYCLLIGQRKNPQNSRPHNLTNVFIGTALLWFGWFGFNGASAFGATPRAAMAAFVTTVAAASGALGWVAVDALRTRKLSGIGFCSGALAGLVGITPASGFVAPWAAIVIGALTAMACNVACSAKVYIGFDDSLDAFGLHGVGGFVGNVLTGVFAQKWVALLDGTVINGGAVDGFPMQIGYQVAGSVAISGYAFIGSLIILFVLDKIPGLNLRISEEEELNGSDAHQMGEIAYTLQNNSTTDSFEKKA